MRRAAFWFAFVIFVIQIALAINHHPLFLGNELETMDAAEAVRKKTHLGAPAGLDFCWYADRIRAGEEWRNEEWSAHCRSVSKLMGIKYPVE